MGAKIYCLVLFIIFRFKKEDLYLWLLIGSGIRKGTVREDDYRDIRKELAGQNVTKITKAMLKKLLADNYYNNAAKDIQKLEAIIGRSILDIFDDNPVFSQFTHLRTLARNREFEIMYYGKVR